MVGYIPYGRFILRRIAGHRNPLLFIPYTLLHQPPFDRHIETSQHGSIGPIAHILTCIIENEFHRTILIRANNIFTIITLYSKIRVYTLEQGRYAVGIIGIMCVDQFILFIGNIVSNRRSVGESPLLCRNRNLIEIMHLFAHRKVLLFLNSFVKCFRDIRYTIEIGVGQRGFL